MWQKDRGIGILGLGNVGGGILALWEMNRAFIEQEIFPYKVKIIGLADLDASRKPDFPIDYKFFTDRAEEVITHPDIQIVVEAVGGEYPAYNFMKQALQAGKHVVTPNKEVIAKHGYELLEIAHQHKVQLLFETSVASAIPILGPMVNMLTTCPLDEINGILNGTTNYILDLMSEENMSREEALKKAQEAGYAEADPSKDIDGVDALYKIFILASLGFRGKIALNQIDYMGINNITLEDIKLAKQLGYCIKLLAAAKKKADKLNIRVQPALIPYNHLLSHIHGAHNGIVLSGNGYGDLFFSGAGAGGLAGASMIISDIIRIIKKPENFEYEFLLQNAKEWMIEKRNQSKQHYFLKIELETNIENKDNINHMLLQKGILIERTSEIKNHDGTLTVSFITGLMEESKVKEIIADIKRQNYIRRIDYLEVYQKKISA